MSDEPMDINAAFQDGTLIDEAIDKAALQAALLHKQAGVPLLVWRDGQVAEIPPDQIDEYLAQDDEEDEEP